MQIYQNHYGLIKTNTLNREFRKTDDGHQF